MRQASSTISRISAWSMAASRTTTQGYRRSEVGGIRNLADSEATRASRSSLGKPKPIRVSSRENDR